jgi:hypothetical protein
MESPPSIIAPWLISINDAEHGKSPVSYCKINRESLVCFAFADDIAVLPACFYNIDCRAHLHRNNTRDRDAKSQKRRRLAGRAVCLRQSP